MFENQTIFTNGNAASNPTKFYKDVKDLEKLNWNCINAEYWNDFDDGKRIRCSEVLVNSTIPTTSIKKIFCSNDETKIFVDEKLTTYPNIKTEINTRFYFNINSNSFTDSWF